MTIHNFRDSLALSHEQSDAPWWEEVYTKAFPTMTAMLCVRDDGWAQRGGIDRQIVLRDGTVLKIDEKVRSGNWPDILLEFWSVWCGENDRRNKPGWVNKDLTCDYIAYAFIPSQTCYLLPFHVLRRTFHDNYPAWMQLAMQSRDGFKLITAQNRGYQTISLAVPTGVLLDSIRDSLVITWGGVGSAA